MVRLDSFSAELSHVHKFACPSSFRANTRSDPGFLLGRNPEPGYLRVSERHISCLCELWRSDFDRRDTGMQVCTPEKLILEHIFG